MHVMNRFHHAQRNTILIVSGVCAPFYPSFITASHSAPLYPSFICASQHPALIATPISKASQRIRQTAKKFATTVTGWNFFSDFTHKSSWIF